MIRWYVGTNLLENITPSTSLRDLGSRCSGSPLSLSVVAFRDNRIASWSHRDSMAQMLRTSATEHLWKDLDDGFVIDESTGSK